MLLQIWFSGGHVFWSIRVKNLNEWISVQQTWQGRRIEVNKYFGDCLYASNYSTDQSSKGLINKRIYFDFREIPNRLFANRLSMLHIRNMGQLKSALKKIWIFPLSRYASFYVKCRTCIIGRLYNAKSKHEKLRKN